MNRTPDHKEWQHPLYGRETRQNFYPLTPKSDQRLISPYNVTPKSHIEVMRIKEMVTNQSSCGLWNKFSSSAPKRLYTEQYGEYAYWC